LAEEYLTEEQENVKERGNRLQIHGVNAEVLKSIPERMARRYHILPLEINGKLLRIAMENPNDIEAVDMVMAHTNMHVETVAIDSKAILEAIDFNYRSYGEIEAQISKIGVPDSIDSEKVSDVDVTETPLIRALTLILDEAIRSGASDIHFQTQENALLVRYRIDGVLHDALTLPSHTASTLISRIKILANLNIADHLRPQDGVFTVERAGHKDGIDIRVGTSPSSYGEVAALRLLDKNRVILELPELGFLNESLAHFQEMLSVPHGMILVSGPTGSGKTTTLYAAINSLDFMRKNIITIEDPVEYHFNHITQIQVNNRAGLTFATGLRSILRLDPDVLLVGEIRDNETAEIACQSALTGHLVLSSVHANDAIGVILRLIDLGIEPFVVASALVGVVSQRMVRKICTNCKQNIRVSLLEQIAYAKATGEERSEFPYDTGCDLCNSGYAGRIGIFETLRLNDEIRTMIINRVSTPELRAYAIKNGMIPLMMTGMLKVKDGITTPSEVLSSAYSIE